jgi:hypothetical protein
MEFFWEFYKRWIMFFRSKCWKVHKGQWIQEGDHLRPGYVSYSIPSTMNCFNKNYPFIIHAPQTWRFGGSARLSSHPPPPHTHPDTHPRRKPMLSKRVIHSITYSMDPTGNRTRDLRWQVLNVSSASLTAILCIEFVHVIALNHPSWWATSTIFQDPWCPCT